MPSLLDLKKSIFSIDNQQHKNFYIFYGEEHYLIYQYINKIAEIYQISDINRVDSVLEINKKINNNSLIKNKKIYIIIDDTDFIKQSEKIWKNFVDNINKDDFIFFIPYSIKSNSKFLKYFDDCVYKFDKMSEVVIEKHLQKIYELNFAFAVKIVTLCNKDYNRCLLEADKVDCYAKATNLNINESFQYCYKNGVIQNSNTQNIYDFIDCLCKRNTKETFEKLNDLYGENKKQFIQNNALLIISLLNGIFKNVLQLQLAGRCKDIVKTTGMSGWEIGRAKKYIGNFNNEDLKYLINLCYRIETGIKTGVIEPLISLDYLVLNIV